MSRPGSRALLLLAPAVGIAGFLTMPPASLNAAPATTLTPQCAACHLATGAGVPGAFPPLRDNVRQLASQPAGRRYLTSVVLRGASGPMTVNGKRYSGVMPAQALSDAAVADALNRALALAGAAATPARFSAREVAGHRTASARLTSAQVARSRPGTTGR